MSSPRSKLFPRIVLKVLSERIERAFPKPAVLAKPHFDIFQRLGAQRAKVHASIDRSADQSSGLEHANVPRDRRQGHGKGLSKLGDHGRLVYEAREEGTTRLVAQGAEE